MKGTVRFKSHRRIWGVNATSSDNTLTAKGYIVSAVGLDEDALRRYIKKQEDEDRCHDQMNLFE